LSQVDAVMFALGRPGRSNPVKRIEQRTVRKRAEPAVPAGTGEEV
jgi:hypothetical protein